MNQHFTDASSGRGATECGISSMELPVSAQWRTSMSDVVNVTMSNQIKVISSGLSCPS